MQSERRIEDKWRRKIHLPRPKSVIAAPNPASLDPYLALESRVLFEVWFVLLRAFTIPELYGPETCAEDDPKSPSDAPTASMADMFRIERVLNVRVTEAKLLRNKAAEKAPRSRKQSRSHSNSTPTSAVSDYYTEVLLDGECDRTGGRSLKLKSSRQNGLAVRYLTAVLARISPSRSTSV
jgi:hypothetical protein